VIRKRFYADHIIAHPTRGHMQCTAARGLTCAHIAACRGHTNASAARSSTLFNVKPARAVRHPVASGPILAQGGPAAASARTDGAVRTLSIHGTDAHRVSSRFRAARRRPAQTPAERLEPGGSHGVVRGTATSRQSHGCSQTHRVAIGLLHAPAALPSGAPSGAAGSIVSRRQRCVTVAGSGRRGTGSTVMCATRVGWLSVPIAPRPPEMLESREQQDWVVSPRETVSHVYGSDEVLLTLGRVVAVVMAAGAGAEVDDKGDGERRGGVRCDGHRVLHAGGPGAHVCGRAVVLLPSGYQGYAPLAKRNETLPSRRLFF